ncbi:MAG TPA: 8-oxo-dGTP diphosphatase [Candidatus Ozemobacteraceae bacterium]|nr:8-oxo-dGTP diphosphatase [Candidatus Ozemobacteraceae bacterium]
MKLATLCYLRREGKTLMLFRNKKPQDIHEGKWNGVGGKFEPGETPETCARREILEECGLTAHTLVMKGFLTFPLFAKGEDWYVFVFLVTDFSGELITSAEGHLEWIPNEKVLYLPLWPGDRHFLPFLDQPGLFSGRFEYVDGQLISHEMIVYP